MAAKGTRRSADRQNNFSPFKRLNGNWSCLFAGSMYRETDFFSFIFQCTCIAFEIDKMRKKIFSNRRLWIVFVWFSLLRRAFNSWLQIYQWELQVDEAFKVSHVNWDFSLPCWEDEGLKNGSFDCNLNNLVSILSWWEMGVEEPLV